MKIYDNTWFNSRFKQVHPRDYDDYSFLENYTNSHTKIRVTHKICYKTFDITPMVLLRGGGCPYCSRVKAHKAQLKPISEVMKSIPDGIELLEEFKGVLKPIKVHCIKCNNFYNYCT